MSKQVREATEKAEKLLAKKGEHLDESLKAELSNYLALSETLVADYRRMKDAAKEKRLDIEENARAIARATRKAKKSLEDKAKQQNAAVDIPQSTSSARAEQGSSPAAQAPAKKTKTKAKA
jgi:hypothetical protein